MGLALNQAALGHVLGLSQRATSGRLTRALVRLGERLEQAGLGTPDHVAALRICEPVLAELVALAVVKYARVKNDAEERAPWQKIRSELSKQSFRRRWRRP